MRNAHEVSFGDELRPHTTLFLKETLFYTRFIVKQASRLRSLNTLYRIFPVFFSQVHTVAAVREIDEVLPSRPIRSMLGINEKWQYSVSYSQCNILLTERKIADSSASFINALYKFFVSGQSEFSATRDRIYNCQANDCIGNCCAEYNPS